MAEHIRLSSLRKAVDAMLDSAMERAESDPSIAMCELGAAALVLGSLQNAVREIAQDAVADGTATGRQKNFLKLEKP
jgi:hypothetical protein